MFSVYASPLATATYQQNIDFLEEHWTKKEVINFIKKVADVIDILKISPQTFQKWSKDTTIYKIEIVKQITLYYQIKSKNVELLLFFNNLQDPNLLYELL